MLFQKLDNYAYTVEVHTCKNYPSVELIGHFHNWLMSEI